ncbi:hypothetical protein [Saccharothrix texasensis]|uniref:Uncharacterized protein n=1 Tax=Saccharothrix texasensis TaxID=103734 RepID=A0A3N1HEG5_9PSEU|nr:hypothetical protein [Saccharothrix texasensis]ROP40908.1 hypothetical protein EDD40_6327 [Saccharothrix texasensis]
MMELPKVAWDDIPFDARLDRGLPVAARHELYDIAWAWCLDDLAPGPRLSLDDGLMVVRGESWQRRAELGHEGVAGRPDDSAMITALTRRPLRPHEQREVGGRVRALSTETRRTATLDRAGHVAAVERCRRDLGLPGGNRLPARSAFLLGDRITLIMEALADRGL